MRGVSRCTIENKRDNCHWLACCWVGLCWLLRTSLFASLTDPAPNWKANVGLGEPLDRRKFQRQICALPVNSAKTLTRVRTLEIRTYLTFPGHSLSPELLYAVIIVRLLYCYCTIVLLLLYCYCTSATRQEYQQLLPVLLHPPPDSYYHALSIVYLILSSRRRPRPLYSRFHSSLFLFHSLVGRRNAPVTPIQEAKNHGSVVQAHVSRATGCHHGRHR